MRYKGQIIIGKNGEPFVQKSVNDGEKRSNSMMTPSNMGSTPSITPGMNMLPLQAGVKMHTPLSIPN